MLTTDVADGVHRLAQAGVNCYLIEEEGRLTIVDAGLPRMWPLLARALAHLGRRAGDVAAVVLTHGHFDHVGFAARAQRELGVPVWAHAEEEFLVAHPYRYAHERSRVLYPLRHPGSIPLGLRMVAAGALAVRGVRRVETFVPDQVLDVPGRPRVVFTPGHTFGHSAFHLPDRDVLLTGDALVTLEPYTGRTGPHIVARAATADSARALRSLDRLEETGASLVLPGHGEPWRYGIVAATEHAREVGAR